MHPLWGSIDQFEDTGGPSACRRFRDRIQPYAVVASFRAGLVVMSTELASHSKQGRGLRILGWLGHAVPGQVAATHEAPIGAFVDNICSVCPRLPLQKGGMLLGQSYMSTNSRTCIACRTCGLWGRNRAASTPPDLVRWSSLGMGRFQRTTRRTAAGKLHR